MHMRKGIFFLVILLITIAIFLNSCADEQKQMQEQYEKCTSVCSSVIVTEDYVTLHLCNEECKKKFLNSSSQ